jgi:Holliday junction resolvase RusA-like endonuclease
MYLPTIVDLVIAQSDEKLSLSFTVMGNPPVQARTKVNWKRRKMPTVYDPTKVGKELFQGNLHRALADCGVLVFPFFSKENTDIMKFPGLQIDVVFHIKRRRADYRSCRGELVLLEDHQKYPGTKDVDNMVKFIMDAFHNVLYHNDNCVAKISATKKFVIEEEKKGGPKTTVTISQI